MAQNNKVTLRRILQVTLPLLLEEYKQSVEMAYHPLGNSFLITAAKDLAVAFIRYQDGGEFDLASVQEMCEYPSENTAYYYSSCICGVCRKEKEILYYHCPSCKGRYMWTTMEHRRTSLLKLLEQFTYLLCSEIQALTGRHCEISIPQCEVILARYIWNKQSKR